MLGRRTSAWLKYKLNQRQEFVIGGFTPGNPFDALIVGCYEGNKRKFVGKVRLSKANETKRTKEKKAEVDRG